jgi:uncharacterized protein (DUF58 family)
MPPTPEEKKLLDPQIIQQAEALGLQARSIVEGYMAGAHKSPFHGFSTEFAQHREYVPGDDPRHLDWKVFGRNGRLVVKQYLQETNFVAQILLDGSESMAYGSDGATKFDYARTLAACLAYLILLQRDAAALAIFDDEIRARHPRTDNIGAMGDFLRLLAAHRPAGKGNIGAILEDMAHTSRRRGIFIVISDFFDDGDRMLEGIRHLRFTGSEVILAHMIDPFELEFPFTDGVEFVGLEGTGILKAHPAEIRKSYLAEFGAYLDRFARECAEAGCDYIRFNTARPLGETLSAYLATRRLGGGRR